MNNKRHILFRTSLCIFSLICVFAFGCESEAHRFKRYNDAISRAEENYILGKSDPNSALVRVEIAIDDAERNLKNSYGRGSLVHCRVLLICRRMKEAGLHNDSEEVGRQAKLLEKLVDEEHYPLDPPYKVNGHVDQQAVIQSITELDKSNLEALKNGTAPREWNQPPETPK